MQQNRRKLLNKQATSIPRVLKTPFVLTQKCNRFNKSVTDPINNSGDLS